MEQGAERPPAACAPRAASPLVILVALVLLGHAALVIAGVFDAARWVPVLECVAVCAIGLSHLRRVSEEPSAGPADVEAAATGFEPPAVPGRMAAPIEHADRVAGT